ncbi:hypothetical protein [Azospirillum sp. sgz302134]
MTDTPGTGRKPYTLPADPLPAEMDYAALCARGLDLVRALAGDLWTEFNASDPGVTTLEQLCFALTELTYRAAYPVEDLLADPRTGRVEPWRQGLYPAHAALTTEPVTVADWRRLILDRVSTLGNVWLTPLPPERTGGVRGLYDIHLAITLRDPWGHPRDRDVAESVRAEKAAVRRVLDVFAAHRALCEDVASVHVLKRLPTHVAATVLIEDGADADAVMAELLFALALRLAPEPARIPLDRRLAAGASSAELFDGPLLLRGFIDDGALAPLPDAIVVDDLRWTMAALPDVVLVRDLTVRLEGTEEEHRRGARIPIPHGCLPELVTAPMTGAPAVGWTAAGWTVGGWTVDGVQPIRLFRGDHECRPDPARVRRLLDRRWAEHRRGVDLWGSVRKHHRPPEGRRLDLAAYSSVQDQFPAVYGIGAGGLPAGSSPRRRAQAKQFKGYLMVFDQMMADGAAQLAFLRDLVSPQAGNGRVHAHQSLADIVPDAAPLLRPDYASRLPDIVQHGVPVPERQAAILEFLLSLYAERLDPPPGAPPGAPVEALVRARQELLRRVVRAARSRGRGLDYRRPIRHRGATGLEIRCRVQLDLIDAAAAERHGGGDAVPVDDPARATLGHPLPAHLLEAVEHHFLPVELMLEDRMAEEEADPMPPSESSPLAGQCVARALLPALAEPGRYRFGFAPDRSSVLVVCRATDGQWWLLGEHHSPSAALTATEKLVRAAAHSHHRPLFIVEHTLLRHAMDLTGGPGTDHGDAYSFRITAVVGATPEESADRRWREMVETVLRDNTPAHIYLDVLYLDVPLLRHFATLRNRWLDALREPRHAHRAEACERLEGFLGRLPVQK